MNIWQSIEMAADKQVFVGHCALPKVLFQGWTGTLDSLMNVRLSLYCVCRAKWEGHLMKNERATTAGLMDDAVQVVELALT